MDDAWDSRVAFSFGEERDLAIALGRQITSFAPI
jgi:hypothetical protein